MFIFFFPYLLFAWTYMMGFCCPVVFVFAQPGRGHNQTMSYIGGPVAHHTTISLTCRSTPTPCDAPQFPLFCSAHTNTPPHVTTLHHWRPAAVSPLGIVGAALTVVGAISSTAQPRLWVKLLTATFCFLCSACCRNGVNPAATRATC